MYYAGSVWLGSPAPAAFCGWWPSGDPAMATHKKNNAEFSRNIFVAWFCQTPEQVSAHVIHGCPMVVFHPRCLESWQEYGGDRTSAHGVGMTPGNPRPLPITWCTRTQSFYTPLVGSALTDYPVGVQYRWIRRT